MGFEEGLVVQLEDCEINARSDRFHRGRKLVARLIGLDLHLAGVKHDVRVGEDAFAFDDHAAARQLARRLLRPWFAQIGIARGREHPDNRVFDGIRLGRGDSDRLSLGPGLRHLSLDANRGGGERSRHDGYRHCMEETR